MVNYTELTDENYKDFVSEGVVLVDVFTFWCGPCKVISPIIDEISSDYFGRIKVGKLDAEKNPNTVVDLLVRNIPTILIYKDGEIVERKVGAIQKRQLTDLIDQYL
jgi:thioredoxin 1